MCHTYTYMCDTARMCHTYTYMCDTYHVCVTHTHICVTHITYMSHIYKGRVVYVSHRHDSCSRATLDQHILHIVWSCFQHVCSDHPSCPIFLAHSKKLPCACAGEGSGKSHLLQSICCNKCRMAHLLHLLGRMAHLLHSNRAFIAFITVPP